MLEIGVTIGIAVVTGLGWLNTKLNGRIHDLDRRVDTFELRIAENYLTKTEFSVALERVEQHMIRIENKLDKLAT